MLILALVVWAIASSAMPVSDPSSLHALLISPLPNSVQESLSEACLAAIQKTLGSGKDFYSPFVVQNSIRVDEFPNPALRNGEFYHWTRASAMTQIAESAQYSRIFSFIRNKCTGESGGCLNGWYLYVAGDLTSSRQYGNILLKVTLPKDARIFDFRGELRAGKVSSDKINSLVENELIQKEPALQACREELYSASYGTPSILEALAFEASGIAANAYYGFQKPDGTSRPDYQWLQILSPEAIQVMKNHPAPK